MATSSPYRAREIIIKRPDGQMLTRADVQYDFLHYVFSDAKPVFTNPFASEGHSSIKVPFADLYLSTLRSSARVTRTLVDLLNSNRDFAIEMAKLAFLINVGRLDTTVSFFPETKTTQRTYHPIPSLQHTPEDHHDGPRLKNYLKWVNWEYGPAGPPKLPADILNRLKDGTRPPTHVFNLLFCLSQNAGLHSVIHLSKDKSIHYLDFFSTLPLSSSHRARAFLWYMYHYLEGGPSNPNPFDDDYSKTHPGKAPRIQPLGTREAGKENVDTVEEVNWAREKTKVRVKFLQELKSGQEYQDKTKSESPVVTEYNVRRRWNTRFVPPVESHANSSGGSGALPAAGPSRLKQEDTQPSPVFEHYISPEHEQSRLKSQRRSGLGGKLQEYVPAVPQQMPTTSTMFEHYIPPGSVQSPSPLKSQPMRMHDDRGLGVRRTLSPPPYPPRSSTPQHHRRDSFSSSGHSRSRLAPLPGHHHRDSSSSRAHAGSPSKSHRSPLTRAFDRMMMDRDNSEDEIGDAEDLEEYSQRLAVISKLRGQPPTPPATPGAWR